MTADHDRIPEIALDWHRAGKRAALATVIETWGSAPRPIGAQLVIDGDGEMMGSVSGGCVEGAVVVEALEALEDQNCRVLEYGVADDDAFAVGALKYEEIWLSSGSGEVHGWWMPVIDPNAPTLLYLHGNGSNISDLTGRALQLHKLGVSVLMIDYRGYGHSSGPFPNEQRVYEDAEAGWQYLTAERNISAETILIYGRSMGGAVGINLATAHPKAAGAIIEASFTSMRDMVRHKYPLLPMPVDWLLTQEFESERKVRSLNMPFLFFHGTADEIVPTYMSQRLYEAAPTHGHLKKELVLIESAGHNDVPWVGGELYETALSNFLEAFKRS